MITRIKGDTWELLEDEDGQFFLKLSCSLGTITLNMQQPDGSGMGVDLFYAYNNLVAYEESKRHG